jgi:hypothetical protein
LKCTIKAVSIAQWLKTVLEYSRCNNITKVAQKLLVSCEIVRKRVTLYNNDGQLGSNERVEEKSYFATMQFGKL